MTPQDPTSDTSTLSFLGAKIKSSEAKGKLETFKLSTPSVSSITLMTDEVYSRCPVTEQPDFGSLKIVYTPGDQLLAVESKSAKLYFQTFESQGIFGEEIAQRVAKHFFDALSPRWITVSYTQRPRGGIAIETVATLYGTYVDSEGGDE